jgi:hypothetical protein
MHDMKLYFKENLSDMKNSCTKTLSFSNSNSLQDTDLSQSLLSVF